MSDPGDQSLQDLADAGYIIDEWDCWQQGGCLDYARALLREYPELQFGTIGRDDGEYFTPTHFFAHDGENAYDSAGCHPMPYLGVHGTGRMKQVLGEDPDWYEEPCEPDIVRATAHIRRHRIGPPPR